MNACSEQPGHVVDGSMEFRTRVVVHVERPRGVTHHTQSSHCSFTPRSPVLSPPSEPSRNHPTISNYQRNGRGLITKHATLKRGEFRTSSSIARHICYRAAFARLLVLDSLAWGRRVRGARLALGLIRGVREARRSSTRRAHRHHSGHSGHSGYLAACAACAVKSRHRIKPLSFRG